MKIIMEPTSTPNNTFSPFNIENIAIHGKIAKPTADRILVEAYNDIVDLANKFDSSPIETINMLVNLIHILIINHLPVEHVAPKMFVLGCSMLKSSKEFANNTAITNVALNSLDNLRILESKIVELMRGYPVKYTDITGLSYKLTINYS